MFVSVCVASQEQKRSLPTPAVKTRVSQQSKGSAVPDILACMLKDTTSEHKAHLFDLKCKICTGELKRCLAITAQNLVDFILFIQLPPVVMFCRSM